MKCLTLCLFLTLAWVAHGQSQYGINKITVSDGLSNGRINDIEKDSLGYMWFATANGLTRYSGSSFKKYELTVKEKASDPGVFKLMQTQDRLLAMQHTGAVFQYDYAYDRWELLFEIPDEIFISLAEIDGQKLIIGTITGFFIYDFQNGNISPRQFEEIRYIRKIKRVGMSVYLSSSKGVHKLTLKPSNEWELERTLLAQSDILDFEIDVHQTIWIGTENEGLYRSNGSNVMEVKFVDNDLLSIRDIEIDDQGSLLIAVDRLGLFVLDAFGNKTTSFSHNPDDNFSISQNSINTICSEKGIIWLGVGELGLNVLKRVRSNFENIIHRRYSKNTISNDLIRAIYQDDAGLLWFGTESGLNMRDLDGNWYSFENLAMLNTPVLSITQYEGKLLLGTYGYGLLSLDLEKRTVAPFSDALPLKRIYAMHKQDGFLWVGGIDGPVYQMKGDSVVTHYATGQVKTFVEKNELELLVGCVEGVYSIDINKRTVEKYDFGDYHISNIYSLHFDTNEDHLWIGNDNGLSQFNFESREINMIDDFNNAVGAAYSILQLTENELWVAAEEGLFKYSISQNRYRKYAAEDGQNIEKFGWGARTILRDKRLAFGGPKGAMIFDPGKIQSDADPYKIYISDFEVNGVSTDPTSKSLNYSESLYLDHNENTLLFEFDFVKLGGSSEFQLDWFLEGYDGDVQSSNKQKTVVYRDLRPGKYVLNAAVYNSDGLISDDQIKLPIEIKKPFWMQWWAFAVYVLILALVIYMYITINRERQNKKFSDEKIKFFVDVAHDIRTPVSLIRLASDQLLEKQNIEESVNIIKRYTSNLNEYVTELLDFQKSERKKLRILASEFDLVHLLISIINDFNPMLDQKSIRVKQDFPERLMIWGDQVQLGRVFTNLISNAIKYNHEGGSIEVEIKMKDHLIQVMVKDTGLGIPKSQIDQIFMRFHRADNALENDVRGTGIGLILSKRIVELHKGAISCQSEEKVGSTFKVELLTGRDHFDPSDIKATESTASAINRLTESSVKGKKSVLLIEDNEDLLAFLKRSLSQDYFIMTATDGKEGLYKLFENLPHLVVSDVMLPSMNGKEICHIVKNDKKTSHIPVILLTALSGMDDKIAGMEVGADMYLEKPFDVEVVKLAIKNLLKRSSIDQQINEKSPNQRKIQNPDESFLSNVIDIINENLIRHDFSIDQLCDKVGLSRSNLFRKMKSITGSSPSDLIQEIKMNKAKELLANEPHARIEDVAYRTGFNDPRYFSTLFKKHFKKTPSEFQAMHSPEG
ncbi:MAG: ATP-binding protein [Bacteroidota bacterium]